MQLKGRIDGIRYPGAPYVWLLITKGENRPSRGSSIDHIGWRAIKLDAKVTELKGKNITMETEQRPLKLPERHHPVRLRRRTRRHANRAGGARTTHEVILESGNWLFG